MRDDISIPVQRLFALRQHPGFADVDLGELATMAENLTEASFPAGTAIATPGTRVTGLHLVVDGQLVSSSAAGTATTWGAHRVFGVLEVISGRSVAAPVIAITRTRTLQLGAADLAEVLEDNFGLLVNAQRSIARHLFLMRERRSTTTPWRRPPQAIAPSVHLGLVERLMVLRQHFPFARIQALAALAQATVERTWQAGEIVGRSEDQADGATVIIDGALRSYRRDVERWLIPNDAVGMLETLAEQRYTTTTEAIRSTRGLHLPAAAISDVMEDHTDLGLGMITMLAGELLDALADDEAHAN